MTELEQMPTTIVAGDSYEITLTVSDYPAGDGWISNLYLRGATTLTITGTASGNLHVLTLPSLLTRNLTEGVYEYSVTVTLDGERTTALNGVITVKPNLATAGTRISHVSRMLSAITQVLEDRITDDVQSLSIAGRSITNIPIAELMELRAQYTRELVALTGGPSRLRKAVPVVFSGTMRT